MFDELVETVNRTVTEFLSGNDIRRVRPTELGLDDRSSWHDLAVTHDFIAVPADANRTMQYYGGFEYVDSEHVTQLGEWVFYSAESERVREHLSRVFPELATEEDW